MNRRVSTLSPRSQHLRLGALCCLWAVLGFLHANVSGAPYGWTAAVVSGGLGLAVLLLAASDSPWASLLTAVILLAISPVVQKAWVDVAAEGNDAITFLKTMLVLGGLLLLAQLEAGAHPQPREEAEEY